MDPPPDYGFDTYKGSGKLKGKVNPHTPSENSPLYSIGAAR